MNEHTNRATLPLASVESHPCHEPSRAQALTSLDPRLIIAITSYRWGKHDPDGVSVKAVLDGIIRAGLLRDDSTLEIQKICLRSKKAKRKENEQTIIEIYNEGENDNAWC